MIHKKITQKILLLMAIQNIEIVFISVLFMDQLRNQSYFNIAMNLCYY